MSTSETRFDITVIGSGPGGYVAAIRAAQLGMKTAVVEMAPLPGGTCLHTGCIPTKALLHSAEVFDGAREAHKFGVRVQGAELDLDAVQKYKDRTVTSNAKGVEYLLKKNGVAFVSGRGRLAGRGKVEVTPKGASPVLLETRKVILATGSAVRGLPGVEFDGERILSSEDALRMRKLPASMIVLGAGAVGVEFASIYASFGSKITLVELLPRVLPLEDAALGAELERALIKRGIAVHTGTKVEAVERDETRVRLSAQKAGSPLRLEADVLLVAVGRRPVTENLGLEGTGVRLERGFVAVDGLMRTGESDVYAIGDIVATPALAHVASHEGIVAAEDAAGRQAHPVDYDRVPSCVYSRPEVASIGPSEEEARRRGHEIAVGTFPFSAVGKAKILDERTGFVRIIAEKKYDEVLGVQILGRHATEMISEAAAALSLEATSASLIETIHAHPTLAEAMGEAALAVHGRAIHM